MANIKELCGCCGLFFGEKLKYCGSCRAVKYCSLKCQKEDWNMHKVECHSLNGTNNGSIKSVRNMIKNYHSFFFYYAYYRLRIISKCNIVCCEYIIDEDNRNYILLLSEIYDDNRTDKTIEISFGHYHNKAMCITKVGFNDTGIIDQNILHSSPYIRIEPPYYILLSLDSKKKITILDENDKNVRKLENIIQKEHYNKQ